jgi:hypothetical protein
MQTANQINEEINERLFERNFPDVWIPPSFTPRPISTRRTRMNVIAPHEKAIQMMPQQFDVGRNFFPGTRPPPFAGYASHIDTETALRGQVYALQKCDLAGDYPSSQSDLFRVPAQNGLPSVPVSGQDPLFKKDLSTVSQQPPKKVEESIMFNYNTRLRS